MAVREATAGLAAKRPKERPAAILENGDPIAAALGSLYAYDMTLSLEAGVKSLEALLAWYRGKIGERYDSEADRKTAHNATRSELQKLASGKDENQRCAAQKLLDAWDKG